MALESSSLSQSSISTKDEFEGLEVDANALWELLYDVGSGGEETESGREAMEVTGQKPGLVDAIYGSFTNKDNNNNSEDIDWFRILEETSAQCNDMGEWYGEPCMEQEINEILVMGDYSLSYTEIMSDDIGYIGLWQDN